MTTFRELRDVVSISAKDKTSRKRMGTLLSILRETKVLRNPTPEKAVATCEKLGPTFIKIGQIASNRSDLLSKEYCDALSKLRTNVPAMDFDLVQRLINESYGHPWQETFATLDPHPLGSASIAQVHKATLHDGTIVAVKVRRPHIVDTMKADIMLMRRILATAEFMTPAVQMLSTAGGLIDELERTTLDELNFNVELNNLIRFYRDTQRQEGVTSPLPFPQYSTEEILVMEFVSGWNITDPETAACPNIDMEQLGKELTDSYVTQVIDNGFFHADPHPGNIIFNGEKIVWIDLGMVGKLSAAERTAVGKIFLSIASNDAYQLKDTLLGIAPASKKVNHGALLQSIEMLLSRYGEASLDEMNVGQAFVELTEMLRTFNIGLPAAFTMLGRGFLTLEGVLEDVAPSISLVQVLSEHVQMQMADVESAREKAKALVMTSLVSLEASAQLPKQAVNTMDMLQKGQLGFDVHADIDNDLLGNIHTMVGRLSFSLIAAALFIGSAMMTTSSTAGPELLDVPVLSYFGFLDSFVLSVYVILSVIRTRHQIRNDLDIT